MADETILQAPGHEGVAVFVSYAREDAGFVHRLHDALVAQGRRVWVDWEGIPPSADWRSEIGAGIEEAGTFVFALSPDSLVSAECAKELEYAVEHGKRILPIVWRDSDGVTAPAELARRNWIFCRTQDNFEVAMSTLADALDTDLDWVHAHTRLLVRAREWEVKRRDGSLLLRGADLRDAEASLAAGGHDPEPTSLQREYVLASRRAATRRQRVTLGAVAVALAVSIALSIFALVQRNTAIDREHVARSRLLAVSAVDELPVDPKVSAAIASEAVRLSPTAEAKSALRQALVESYELLSVPGHDNGITSLAMSSDGTRIATADRRTARVWDARTLKPMGIIHGELARGLSLNKQGTRIAGSDGVHAGLWDVASGRRVAPAFRSARGLDDEYGPHISHDARYAVTASARGTGEVRDTATARIVATLKGPRTRGLFHSESQLEFAAFSADNRRVVAAGEDFAGVWDVHTGQRISWLQGPILGVFGGVFSPDGSLVVLNTSGSNVAPQVPRVWDVISGRTIMRLPGHPTDGTQVNVTGVFMSPRGAYVATTSRDRTAHVWSVRGRRLVSILSGHREDVLSTSFSPDERFVLTTSTDGTARVWETVTGAPVAVLRGTAYAIAHARFVGDAGLVVTAGGDGKVRLWDSGVGIAAVTFPLRASHGASAEYRSDGRRVVTTMVLGQARLWDAAGRRIAGLAGTTGFDRLHFSQDGRLLAGGGLSDGSVHLWSGTSGRPLRTIQGGRDESVTWLAVDPYARFVATASEVNAGICGYDCHGWLRLLDVRTGRGLPVARGSWDDYDESIQPRVAFSPDGRWLAATTGSTLHLWRLETRALERRIDLGQPVTALDFSYDGSQLAVALPRGGGRILGAADGWTPRRLDLPDGVDNLSFRHDGDVVLGTTASSAHLVDAQSGRPTAELAQFTLIHDASFSPDGRFVVSAAPEGITVWDATAARRMFVLRRMLSPSTAVFSPDGGSILASGERPAAAIYRCEICVNLGDPTRLAQRLMEGLDPAQQQAYRRLVHG